MSDIYYTYMSYEFLLMNFYIYFAILLIYLLMFLMKTYEVLVSGGFLAEASNKTSFLRYQDMQKQTNQTATVRVWSKTNTKNNSD